ncbi:hypothetical protein LCGC14_1800460 [marine sediment metagenome]|uniref:Uncharacterized protein n=1 Tax=marine sediment metagenome TaxID=412755 RepID=A0A0F9J4L4_9ZZZZ
MRAVKIGTGGIMAEIDLTQDTEEELRDALVFAISMKAQSELTENQNGIELWQEVEDCVRAEMAGRVTNV